MLRRYQRGDGLATRDFGLMSAQVVAFIQTLDNTYSVTKTVYRSYKQPLHTRAHAHTHSTCNIRQSSASFPVISQAHCSLCWLSTAGNVLIVSKSQRRSVAKSWFWNSFSNASELHHLHTVHWFTFSWTVQYVVTTYACFSTEIHKCKVFGDTLSCGHKKSIPSVHVAYVACFESITHHLRLLISFYKLGSQCACHRLQWMDCLGQVALGTAGVCCYQNM